MPIGGLVFHLHAFHQDGGMRLYRVQDRDSQCFVPFLPSRVGAQSYFTPMVTGVHGLDMSEQLRMCARIELVLSFKLAIFAAAQVNTMVQVKVEISL